MPTSTPTDARPRGAARRDALLDAVLRLVAEGGVDAVTHRRVAEVAGLPLASTTYWFESKEQLLTAALERAADEDTERLRAFLGETAGQAGDRVGQASDRVGQAGDRVGQAADPVGLAVAALLGPNDSQSSRGWLLATYALMLEAARMPALRDVTMRWTAAYLEAIPPLLAAAGSRHPRSDAELLLAAADGLLVEQLATDDASDLAPRLRRLADALVRS